MFQNLNFNVFHLKFYPIKLLLRDKCCCFHLFACAFGCMCVWLHVRLVAGAFGCMCVWLHVRLVASAFGCMCVRLHGPYTMLWRLRATRNPSFVLPPPSSTGLLYIIFCILCLSGVHTRSVIPIKDENGICTITNLKMRIHCFSRGWCVRLVRQSDLFENHCDPKTLQYS